jgi:hypothetical protein
MPLLLAAYRHAHDAAPLSTATSQPEHHPTLPATETDPGQPVLGDPLPAAVMQDLTREVRQFETVFLAGVDLLGRSARLRIFTEDEELEFAGHPVLDAAAVLHTLLPAPDAEEIWALEVAEQTVEVRTRGADRWVDATMDQGVPQIGPAIAGELAQAYRDALNLSQARLHSALPMQVVSTGLPYLTVPVQAGLERARISHPGFEGLLGASAAKFVYVLDPDRPEGRTWTTSAGWKMSRRQRGRPSCWLPVAPRRPSRRGTNPGPPGPVHRAAQHDRGSPRPDRPAVGWRAGGVGRGRTLPRPSDLTAVASAGTGLAARSGFGPAYTVRSSGRAC